MTDGIRQTMSELPPGIIQPPPGTMPPDATRPDTWTTWREALKVVLAPDHVRTTLPVAAVVGTLLLIINQLDTVLKGQIGLGLLFKALLTYLVPFLVCNYGLLAATRGRQPHR